MIKRCMRRLEFDAAHRLVNHEGLCANLHGHRYAAEIECEAELDSLGRVIDFGIIKETIGKFIADSWDHSVLLNNEDEALISLCRENGWRIYVMPVNPTAENIAAELIHVAKNLIAVRVTRIRVWETPSCYAEVVLR